MRTLPSEHRMILPFEADQSTLALSGGKGMNLSLLARAGFPVPGGFIITTVSYESFVNRSGIVDRIHELLAKLAVDTDSAAPRPDLLEDASETIAGLFRAHAIQGEVVEEIKSAYRALGSPPVAVRSSATAEDLPNLSFAGQQETFLNVVGEDSLTEAVSGCWASLWTARAIGYRLRNRIPNEGISLAVVIQQMVDSETSGVMFTANPLTGLRSESVIESIRGLGEALVSGQVEPDRFVVDRERTTITERTIGAKALAIRSREGGGTVQINDGSGTDIASLDDPQILELAALGDRVAAHYGSPQDIEWARAGGTYFLLQSRAITSLYPLPGAPSGSNSEGPLKVYFSFAAIQGLLDPITPFGADLLRQIFTSVSHLFGTDYTRDNQSILLSAGARLWVNFTTPLRSSFGRRAVRGALTFIEPTIKQALEQVWDDVRLQPENGRLRLRTIVRLLRFFGPLAANVILNLAAPRRRRSRLVRRSELLLQRTSSRQVRSEAPLKRLSLLVDTLERVFNRELPLQFIRLISGVSTGMLSLNLLNRQVNRALPQESRHEHGMSDLVLEVNRGVPHNPTTEMDLEMWRIATLLREDSAAMAVYVSDGPPGLLRCYLTGKLNPPAQTAIESFFGRYGARGLAEIDAGRPRWRDEPEHLFETLGAYLETTDPDNSPAGLFRRGAGKASDAVGRIEMAARASASGLRGRARASRVRFAASRAREFLGFREYPKFFAIRMLDIFRQQLKTIGEELAREQELSQADDIFYLTLTEHRNLGKGLLSAASARAMIAERREEYQRELLRRQIPRLIVSDGRTFYEGMSDAAPKTSPRGADAARGLVGSPVSPGIVEGRARVVLDPRQSALKPGEIMVCPGTDPSWTPLFLVASGLVMEVGGMMTHGAVVAREYGLPAVVGVHEATSRITTGMLIRVDGSAGNVEIVDEGGQ